MDVMTQIAFQIYVILNGIKTQISFYPHQVVFQIYVILNGIKTVDKSFKKYRGFRFMSS